MAYYDEHDDEYYRLERKLERAEERDCRDCGEPRMEYDLDEHGTCKPACNPPTSADEDDIGEAKYDPFKAVAR